MTDWLRSFHPEESTGGLEKRAREVSEQLISSKARRPGREGDEPARRQRSTSTGPLSNPHHLQGVSSQSSLAKTVETRGQRNAPINHLKSFVDIACLSSDPAGSLTGVGVTVRSSTDDVVGELGGSKGVRSSVIFVDLGVRGRRKGWVKELCASQAFSASSVPIFVEGRGTTLGPITLPDYHQVDTDALSARESKPGNCQFADIRCVRRLGRQ